MQGTHETIHESLETPLLLGSSLQNDHDGILHSDQQDSQVTLRPDGVTFFRTILNGLNVLAGVGILSTPYAVSQGGWLGMSFLFVVAALCCYTGILLQRCMQGSVNPHINLRCYPGIGEAAFGRAGRITVSIFLYLELYAYAVAFLLMEGDNLAQLFPQAISTIKLIGGISINSRQSFTLLSALAFLFTVCLRDMSVLDFISASGVAACVVLMFAVGWVGVFDGIRFGHSTELINISGLPVAVGLYTLCYGGHAVFPTIYSSMRDRKRFPQVLFICFFLSTLMYASIGALGYMMFGNELSSQVTLNLPKSAIASKLAIYTTLLTPLAKYRVMINPLAVALEELILTPSPSRIHVIGWSVCIRTMLVASTVSVAVAVPFFGYLMAFTGSFLSSSISIIIPCICYLKIFRRRVSSREIVIIMVVLLFGIIASVVGTYSSLRDIGVQNSTW